MTAKELLLQEAPRWSEDDAEAALRAVKDKHEAAAEPIVEEWGELDAWSDAASSDTMRMLDEDEAAAGFSWEQHSSS